MSQPSRKTNEEQVQLAFSRQAVVFDAIYADNAIVSYKRDRVRAHIMKYLKPGSNLLELNSGTGDDAVFFASQWHKVHATDISVGMQQQLERKVANHNLQDFVTNEICSFTTLRELKNKGPYHHIFSNFAGLNCTGELGVVLKSLPGLLHPEGVITLVVLPKFCLWETLLVFKGKFGTAFRRFFSGKGVEARVEDVCFKCWYYNPSYIVKCLRHDFDVLAIEGLCTLVPPSYMEGFAEKHPQLYSYLQQAEERYKHAWPWKYIGDYYIISLKRKAI